MVASGTTPSRALSNLTFTHVAIALALLTAIRIVGLHASVVDLYMDEAQYWAWSRELAFGYFSKPPLLAWIIAATDPVCGSGEACVRAASPLMHFATALLVYAIAENLYNKETAAWSALAYGLAPGVIFSARIISTDVPLLLFWAVALLAYVRLLPGPSWRWSVVLGLALGVGMLAKYAMIYFLLCAACAACFDRDARALLWRPQTWAALGIAGLLLIPNFIWNAENNFMTLRHTGDNITGGGLSLDFFEPFEFVVSQFAVIGPPVFATFLYILARIGRR
jgi:4-amino-4-deoxy-L-arabinose transferase-like glycosyltransferase